MKRCPIENPHYCVGTRCQLFGICDYNRQLDAREQHDGWANGVQGPSETLNPLHVAPASLQYHSEVKP